MAVGAVRLGRRRVLVQELAAIEVLARVDVVCLDKTGTLTEGTMTVSATQVLEPTAPVSDVLGALAAADANRNASMRAWPPPTGPPSGGRPRSWSPSPRSGSGAPPASGDRGAWVLGAPEVVLERARGEQRTLGEEQAAAGHRVLLLARAPAGLAGDRLPEGLVPAALVALEDRIRAHAADTLGYFARQGVALKIISGDHPATVAAVARRVGVGDAAPAVDARHLPSRGDELGEVVERATVFGRVGPHQKRAMVAALQARGHVVAMTGDGVNDVLALKDADIGVALGSGSSASRAVAKLVLLDSSFDALPAVVAEGRRVIANVERVANLFVTKSVYATLLALAVGVARLPFPFLPRHLTVVTAFTIGIPAFFLALAPNATRARPGFVRRVLRFALPAGTVAATATFTTYALARIDARATLEHARTAAAVVLFSIGLWVLGVLARPLTPARRWLLAAMVAGFVAVLTLPALRGFYALSSPPPTVWVQIAVASASAWFALEAGWRVTRRWAGTGHENGPRRGRPRRHHAARGDQRMPTSGPSALPPPPIGEMSFVPEAPTTGGEP